MMMKKIRLLLRDFIVAMPFGKSLQRKIWTHREDLKGRKFEARCRNLQKNGSALLTRLHETLTSANVKYFIDFGTLLGCIREKNFIKHDDDVDIAIVPPYPPPHKMLEIMEFGGFTYRHHFEYENRVVEYTFERNGVGVDLFLNERIADGRLRYFLSWREMNRPYPTQDSSTFYWANRKVADLFPEMPMAGTRVCVPDNYEEVLLFYYGDWRVPCANRHANDDSRHEEGVKGEMPGYSYVYHDRKRLLSK